MDEIYINVDHGKSALSRPSANQTGPSSSQKRPGGAAVLCLGLLNVLLLAGLIGLGVHYHDSVRGAAADLPIVKDNLTHRLEDSDNTLSSLTEDRDQLKANFTEVTGRWTRLLSLFRHGKMCPGGWTVFGFSFYFLSNESGSWANARADCRHRGADLVVIDSEEEQTFLSSSTEDIWRWIGLTDGEQEGRWKWIDGAPLSQSYWEENQPDNGSGSPKWGDEDCVHIKTESKAKANWNDLSCNASLRWICEMRA